MRGCSPSTPFERFRLRDVKHCRSPGTPDNFLFAGVGVDFFALGFNESRYLDAVLASANNATQRFPRLKGEHVLSRLDLRFRDSFRQKSVEDRRKIAERFAVDCSP